MKAQILKIAKCKDGASFYKKFPTEESFMAKYGKEFKKAQLGASMGKYNVSNDWDENNPTNRGTANSFDLSNQWSKTLPGSMPKAENGMAPMLRRDQLPGSTNTKGLLAAPKPDTSQLKNMAGVTGGAGDLLGKANAAMPYIGAAVDVVKGLSAIKGQKDKVKNLQGKATVSGLQLQAARTKPIDNNGQDQDLAAPASTGEEFFPVDGVGTDPLGQAKNGAALLNKVNYGGKGEIQNTYAPNNMYQDLGYEPLNDSEQIKSFWGGGNLPKAQFGADILTQVGGDLLGKGASALTNSGQGPDAGSMIGKGAGTALGTAFFGPIGGMVGGAAGSIIGGLIDTSDTKMARSQSTIDANNQATSIAQMNMSSPFQKDGGWVSHDWQPQVITKFGDIDVSELHSIAHQGMDSLRSGGNIRENFKFPQDELYKAQTGLLLAPFLGLGMAANKKMVDTVQNSKEADMIKQIGTAGLMQNGGYTNMGGDLQVYKGEAESMSHNPYLPEGGETIMFRGPSHADGGMPIKYGEQGVEVEGGEPAVKLAEGGEVGKALTVFGNITPSSEHLTELGLQEFKGQKFKSIVDDLAKKTAKLNVLKDKSVDQVNKISPTDQFASLAFNGNSMNLKGIDMQQQKIAKQTRDAAFLQDLLNSEADANGLDPETLAKGKITKAKINKTTAKDGDEFKTYGQTAGSIDFNPIAIDYNKDYWNSEENYKKNWMPKVEAAFSDPEKAKGLISQIENYGGQDAADVKAALAKGKTPEEKIAIAKRLGTDQKIGPYHKLLAGLIGEIPTNAPMQAKGLSPIATQPLENKLRPMTPPTVEDKLTPSNKFPWMDAINAVVPYTRPNYQLDRPDLTAEMMAAGFNQQDPVQARLMHSQLDTPYDISYQDMLNKNQGDFRAMQKMAQNNPAMASMMGAQKYAANQQVLGEQFRQNQAMKDKVYGQNRATINQDQLTNLGIMERQADKQAGAKAKTQEEAIRIASSISDKLNNYKKEQKMSDIEQQRYNFRVDSSGRPINMNPLAQFNMSGNTATGTSSGASEAERIASYEDYIADYKDKKREDRKARNSTATAMNGTIVKALKTI